MGPCQGRSATARPPKGPSGDILTEPISASPRGLAYWTPSPCWAPFSRAFGGQQLQPTWVRGVDIVIGDRWHSFRQSSRIAVHDVRQLWKGDDRLEVGRPFGYTDHRRCVHWLPSILVRSAQKPAALSRLYAQADEVYR